MKKLVLAGLITYPLLIIFLVIKQADFMYTMLAIFSFIMYLITLFNNKNNL